MADAAATLVQAIGELKEFLAAIAEERRCLIKGDIDRLPALAEKKSALATRLASLDSKREAALADAGFGSGRAGAEAWLAALPAASRPQTGKLWRQYLELAAQGGRENELNGKLLAARQQENYQALAALLGEGGDAATYGSDGQRSQSSGKRPLGSA